MLKDLVEGFLGLGIHFKFPMGSPVPTPKPLLKVHLHATSAISVLQMNLDASTNDDNKKNQLEQT